MILTPENRPVSSSLKQLPQSSVILSESSTQSMGSSEELRPVAAVFHSMSTEPSTGTLRHSCGLSHSETGSRLAL